MLLPCFLASHVYFQFTLEQTQGLPYYVPNSTYIN